MLLVPSGGVGAQASQDATASRERRPAVRAIAPPRNPLPAESASANVTRFSFIAYGDTRGRRDGVAEQFEHGIVVDAMLRRIRELESGPDPVRFVLQSGDAVVDGRDAAQWNRSFVSLIDRLTTLGGVPYFLAPGNHDVTSASELRSPARQIGLQHYLQAVSQLIPPDRAARRLSGYPTYAFGYGNSFVLAFDSNIAGDSTQYAWVKQQLEGLDRRRYRHVVVFFHHPPLSSGPHGGSVVEPPADAVRARYLPLFRQHGVRIVLTGHEHFFEHWIERYRGADGAWQRLDHLVSGGGGAPIYTYSGPPDQRRYRRTSGNADVRLTQLVRPGRRERDNPYHFLVVHVNGDDIAVEYVGVDWGAQFRPYGRPSVSLIDRQHGGK
jgi:3',5'-cyclic AMP phosphodiesterase CpdA